MSTRGRRRRGAVRRTATAFMRPWRWCGCRAARAGQAIRTWLAPWRPVVIVDARRGRANRLKRDLVRATRAHVRALGAAPPGCLVIVVQRVVQDTQPLSALLQVFTGADGVRRHVLFVALTVEGRQVSDDEVLATLRHQLHHVLGDEIGELTRSVPLRLEHGRTPEAPVVTAVPGDAAAPEDAGRLAPGRSPVPITRVEDDVPFIGARG